MDDQPIKRSLKMKNYSLIQNILSGLFILIVVTGCHPEKKSEIQPADSERLHQFLKESWDDHMREFPEWATQIGYPGLNDQWTDYSLEAIQRRRDKTYVLFSTLQSLNRKNLSDEDRLNYDLFQRAIKIEIEGERFHTEYMPIDQLHGIPQVEIPRVISMMPRSNVKQYEDILARLRKIPPLMDQLIVLLEKGRESHLTQPQIVLRDVPEQIKNLLTDDPLKSGLMRPFTKFQEMVSPEEQSRLLKEATAVFLEKIVPAYQKLQDYLVKTYIPAARITTAAKDLPNGTDYYAYWVKRHTTTHLSPQEIHQIGLNEVKRIRNEMDKVIQKIGFQKGYIEFCRFLNTDEQFTFKNTFELLQAFRDAAKRADPELAKLFKRIPRMPYGIQPVPSHIEKSTSMAYYEVGSFEAGRPGYFYANTYDLPSKKKWDVEALTLHEAVPGHHMQLSLAQEMEGVPEFRKYMNYTSYSEGWGLYAESLGDQMGFYQDPYSKFGQLTAEIWRAARLVVDTGIHSLGWSRQQAIDYLKEMTAKSDHDCVSSVDRYIVWPGQALAYKIGELKIKELRAYVTTELGENFDLRTFHDEILGHGALPLDILETQIKQWVAQQKELKNK